MKILALGIGQCGGRLADEFERLNKKARRLRGVEIVTGAFAVDTDSLALSSLESIKNSYQRRILVGVKDNHGRGNIAMNRTGAEIVRQEAEKVIEALYLVKRFQETDAILVVGSGAGGTGSGGLPVIIQSLKERYKDKPAYGLIVLPFAEETGSEKRHIFNTASCLKSSYAVADGIFLVDNQKYVQRTPALKSDMERMNQLIVEPFYNLLSAGEEKTARHIGSKLLDAGDIIQTVKGWTVLGHGESHLSLARRLMKNSLDFSRKSRETDIGMKTMEEAINRLSLKCNPATAANALYLLSAPAREISVNLLDYLGDYMKKLAANAVIRSGDYPIRKGLISIDIIFSQLEAGDRVQKIYEDSVAEVDKKPDQPDKSERGPGQNV